jgi:hypothetical protein
MILRVGPVGLLPGQSGGPNLWATEKLGRRDEYHGLMRFPGMATYDARAGIDPTVLLVARRHVDFGRLASALCRQGF